MYVRYEHLRCRSRPRSSTGGLRISTLRVLYRLRERANRDSRANHRVWELRQSIDAANETDLRELRGEVGLVQHRDEKRESSQSQS